MCPSAEIWVGSYMPMLNALSPLAAGSYGEIVSEILYDRTITIDMSVGHFCLASPQVKRLNLSSLYCSFAEN